MIDFKDLIDKKEFKKLQKELEDNNSVDIAEYISTLNKKDLIIVFRMLKKEKAALVFSYISGEIKSAIIDLFTGEELNDILLFMANDNIVDYIENDIPANLVNKILENSSLEKRKYINQLLNYPEDSAGSIMTTEYISLREDMSVKQALEKIRKIGIRSETIYTCYITKNKKLEAIITAKDLLINGADTIIKDIQKDKFIYVNTYDDREDVAKLFRKYSFIAIPVLDNEGCMVGIVTFDDAINVLTKEATEDIHKMAAIQASEKTYLETGIFEHAKKRIIWLLVLMLSATITGRVIENYESSISIIPLLVAFIPMLMDTGGNCGSQSSTLIIRAFAVDEVSFKDSFKIMWKEFRVSIIVSIILAIANGIRIIYFYNDTKLALIVALTLIATVIISKMVGCTLPIIAKKLNLDPAIMAAPLITTVVDTFSILVYFKIAIKFYF